MIVPPGREVTDENGNATLRFEVWTEAVTRLSVIVGTGTPEASVEALQGRLYMDDAGTAGNILYIKRDADIGGDRSKGWILV